MSQPSLKDYTIVILCGGQSSRMGEDKALLPFANKNSLAQYQLERLQPHFKHVYLSSKVNKFDFLSDDTTIIYDEGEVHSPMVALQSILKACKEDKLFILTVDTPLVTIESMQRLLEASQGFEITVAKTQKLHNLCGFFSTSLLQSVNECLEQDIHKIGFLLKKAQTKELEFSNDEEFLNLNHKEEYVQAIKIISALNNNY